MIPILLALGVFTLIIDTHPPSIVPLFQNNTILSSPILKFNITDDTGIKSCYYYLNGVKNTFDCKEIELSSGCYNITIEAVDLVGRVAKENYYICIDSEPPIIISYGFYPSNNSLPARNYTFWIEAKDDFRITKIYAIVNGKVFYGNKISPDNIQIGKNIITWIVCDTFRCTNKTLVYYVRYNPQVLLLEVPEEVFLGECFNITYKTNLEKVNLTINNTTFTVKGEGTIKYCPKSPGKLIIKLLNETKIIYIVNAVNTTLFIKNYNKEYYVEVKYKNKILYKGKNLKHSFLLPERAELLISADRFIIKFISPELRKEMILFYSYKNYSNFVIYNFSTNFKFDKAILYLYSPFDYYEVYICKEYKNKCISEWEKVKYIKQGKYAVVTVNSLSAFKIEKKECNIKIFYENPIYAIPGSSVKTVVYIQTNDFCPRYDLKVNYTCIIRKIDRNAYELIFNAPDKEIVINISYGPKFALVKVIPREFGYLMITPLQKVIYAFGNETSVNFRVNNMLNKKIILNVSSDLGKWVFYIGPMESKIIRIKVPVVEGEHLFYFRYLNESKIIRIRIINATRYVSLNITLLKKEPPYLIKIEMSSRIPIKTIVCYGIKNEYEKCENITITGYTYIVRSVTPKKPGLKEIYAKIGDKIARIYIAYSSLNIKISDILPYIALAVISLIVTKLIVK